MVNKQIESLLLEKNLSLINVFFYFSKSINLLIDNIIKYREQDNFGSLEEVEELFKANNASDVYDKIKSYIVIR